MMYLGTCCRIISVRFSKVTEEEEGVAPCWMDTSLREVPEIEKGSPFPNGGPLAQALSGPSELLKPTPPSVGPVLGQRHRG